MCIIRRCAALSLLGNTVTNLHEFSPELCELIGWFRLAWHQLPPEPFTLRPGVQVSDTERFYASLAQDIRAGPAGPRAQSTALQQDLADLRRHIDRKPTDGQKLNAQDRRRRAPTVSRDP